MSNYSTEKEDEKKGGGVPPWMTGSAKVGSGLSSGGAGQAGGLLARLGALLAAPKAIVAATVLGGMALGMGVVSTIQEPKQPSLAQRFNKEKGQAGSASGLPGMEQPGQSALNMAQSANSGFFGDPNAAAQAPAAAEGAADAPADAASDPALDAAAAGAVAGGAAGAGSPEELGAALTGKQKSKAGLAGGRFGKLSAGLGGGGLAGGAGLSGGIGGSFKQNLGNSRAGDLRGFQGANRAQVSRGKLAAKNVGGSALKGANAKRLDNMNRAMGNARTGGAEAGAATHAAQWDAATPSGGAITGGGASGMSEGGQFSDGEGVGGGGPLDQNSSTTNNPNDDKDVGAGKNVTPYQSQIDMAQGMLMLASVLLIITAILAEAAPATFGATEALGMILYGAVIALAAGAAIIGTMIGTKYGQGAQGGIIGAGGALVAGFGVAALAGAQLPWWAMTLAGVGGLAMSVWGMLRK